MTDPRLHHAIEEIQGVIAKHYPTASFSVDPGFDPDGTYITASVDVEDTDDVYDLVIHRLGQLQVDEGLPLYLGVVPTPERLERLLAEYRAGAARLNPPGA